MRRLSLLASLIPLVAAVNLGLAGTEGQVPCSDPRGCPDLATDHPSLYAGWQNTEFFSPDDCAVLEGSVQPGERHLLRVSFTFGNIGAGDLELGAPREHPEWFEWSDCHDHFHVKDHASFRVWTPEGFRAWDALRKADPALSADEVLEQHPELASEFVAGRKQGFCIVSQEPYPPGLNGAAITPDPLPEHNQILLVDTDPLGADLITDVCSENQGQDPGWADTYASWQDGMWVDVTDLPTGVYMLEGEMNANHFIVESRYDNNRAAVPIVIPETFPALPIPRLDG